MKSFSDYLKNRSDLNIYEMAAPPVTYTGPDGSIETVEEVRKVPIFLDQDDIDYLYQFPPKFWVNALLVRYGKLLHSAHEEREKGGKIDDEQNIQVAKGTSFRVDTKINKLYDKLTDDVDDKKYSELVNDEEGRREYARHVEQSRLAGKSLGTYGFVLKGYKRDKIKGKEVGVALGYMEPEISTIQKRLGSWYKAIEDGWYDKEMPENSVKMKIDFSGNKGGRKKRGEKSVGKILHVYPDEKTWRSNEGNVYSSYLPILKPAIMVETSAVTIHDSMLGAAKQIFKDISDESFEDYFKLIDTNEPDLLNKSEVVRVKKRISDVEEWLKKYAADKAAKKVKGYTGEYSSKKEEQDKLKRLEIAIEFIQRPRNSTILRQKLRSAKSNEEKKAIIKGFLGRVHDRVRQRAENIRSTAQRHDVHSWNISHFSPRESNPHTGWTGFGTINVGWQQPEVTHTAFQSIFSSNDPSQTDRMISEFWNHIIEDKKVKHSVYKGVVNKIEMIRPKDIVEQAIKDALIENKEEITTNAIIYFRNKGAHSDMIHYAALYKKKIIDGSSLDKKEEKRMESLLRGINGHAVDQGNNYCGIVFQLHERLKHPEKWNRLIRPINPGQGASPPVTLEEIFRVFYQIHSGAWSVSSHRISTVGGVISDDPMRRIVDRSKEKVTAPTSASPSPSTTPQGPQIPEEFRSPESLTSAIVGDSSSSDRHTRREENLFTKICLSVGKKLQQAATKTFGGLFSRWGRKKS